MASAKIELIVNGNTFDGFATGTVQLTMEGPVNSFDFEYVADGTKPQARSIYPGDECELKIDAGSGFESLIKGYVDATEDEDTPDGIMLRCRGRSKTADLIDCSAIKKPGSWTNASVSQIAADIAKPFGVDVFLEGSGGAPLPKFSITNGETAFDAIQRAALLRFLTPYSVGDHLVITQAGSVYTGTTLARGVNIVSAHRVDDWSQRYSDYIFDAQTPGGSKLKATSGDSGITRYRVLRQQVSAKSLGDLKSRADIEATRRGGSSEQFSVTTSDWGTIAGKAWRPNTLVTFTNKVLGVDAELIVQTVNFSFAAGEPRQAELTLLRPEAYLPEGGYPALKRGAAIT